MVRLKHRRSILTTNILCAHQHSIPLFLPSLLPDRRHHGDGCFATWRGGAGGGECWWQPGDAVQEGTSQQAHQRSHTWPRGRETKVQTVNSNVTTTRDTKGVPLQRDTKQLQRHRTATETQHNHRDAKQLQRHKTATETQNSSKETQNSYRDTEQPQREQKESIVNVAVENHWWKVWRTFAWWPLYLYCRQRNELGVSQKLHRVQELVLIQSEQWRGRTVQQQGSGFQQQIRL